jgi:hypothetical protein
VSTYHFHDDIQARLFLPKKSKTQNFNDNQKSKKKKKPRLLRNPSNYIGKQLAHNVKMAISRSLTKKAMPGNSGLECGQWLI